MNRFLLPVILLWLPLKLYAQPANDNACNATEISVGFNSPFTNVGASVQFGEPSVPTGSCNGQGNWCSGEPAPQMRNTVWFMFTVPANGTGSYSFRVNGNTSNFDSQIALFEAATCTDVTNGNAVLRAANDDSLSSPYNSYMLAYCLTPSDTYYVVVDGYSSATNSNFFIEVVELPHSFALVNAGPDQTVCYSLLPQIALNGTVQGTPGSITWTTTGDGYFTDSTQLNTFYVPGINDKANGLLHLIVSTDNPAGNCNATTDSLLLHVIADSMHAGNDMNLCAGEDYVQLNAQHFLFTSFAWTSDGDGFFSNEASLNAKYFPGAADRSGAYFDLVLRGVSTQCFNTYYDTVRIYNTQGTEATVMLEEELISCSGDSVALSPSVLTDFSSVVWSTSGDGTFTNAASASTIYIPGPGDKSAGTVQVFLSAAGINPCQGAAWDSTNLILLPKAEIQNINFSSAYCSSEPVVLNASVVNYSSLQWSTAGDGSFTDETALNTIYIPGPGDLASGTVQVSLTAHSVAPCALSDLENIQFAISPAPEVEALVPAMSCASDPIPLNAIVSNFSSIHWSSEGDGFFDNSSAVKPIYSPGPLDVALGFVNFNVIVFGNSPCNPVFGNGTVSITGNPVINAGSDMSSCVDEAVYLEALAVNQENIYWSTDGDGVFDDTSSLITVYYPGPMDYANGSVNLFVLAEGAFPCTSTSFDVLEVTFIDHATVDAGPDDDIVAGQPAQLEGFASSAGLIYWTTQGDGTFNDSTALDAQYFPGPGDIANGNVVLQLHATDIAPCGFAVVDEVEISIYPDALLAVKIYIEGLYNSGSLNSPLFNTGGADPAIADSFTVVFHETVSPYNSLLEIKGALGVNGLMFVTLPPSMAGNAYYLSLKHRNSIETWSRQPYIISSFGLFDFTASPVLRPAINRNFRQGTDKSPD